MRQRDLILKLDPSSGPTLVVQIARAVEKAILEDRIRPGEALPGTRALAEALGASRNTVIAALAELENEGWLVSEPNRGTFVAPCPPSPGQRSSVAPRATATALGFDLPSRLNPISAAIPGALNLSDGLSDSRLAPTEEMAKAYQRAIRRHGEDLLKYGEPQGNRLLREALAKWVTERHGVSVDSEQILVTRGGRMALTLISTALLRAGDLVGVESPGNRAAWTTITKASKAETIPIEVDDQGLSPRDLARVAGNTPMRMLYLTPRCQFPTTVSMSPARAQDILALAAEHRLAIFEDDYDAEIHFDDAKPLPLFAQDTTGQVIFAASLSRILAPGLRLGYLVVPPALVAPLARLRQELEAQGDRVLEWAVADLIRDGELARHVRRTRKVYEERRDCMAHFLRQELGSILSFTLPSGGLSIWAEVAPGVDVDAWIEDAKTAGIVLNEPRKFFHGPEARPFLRIGFGQVNEPEIQEAVQRLKESLPD